MPASKFYLSLRLFAQILPLQLPALKSCGRRLASLDRVSLSEARSAVGDASPSPKVHCWHQLTRCATAMAETDQKFEANAETLRPSCQLNFIFLEIPFEYKLFFWIADSYFVRYSLSDLNNVKFTSARWTIFTFFLFPDIRTYLYPIYPMVYLSYVDPSFPKIKSNHAKIVLIHNLTNFSSHISLKK